MSTELVQVEEVQPEKFGIEQKQATELMGDLPLIKQERENLKAEFQEVIKLDIEQPETAQIAGDLRKRILKNRTQGIERWHKDAKQFFLRGGQFVDEIKRMEIRVNEAMEQVLAQIEKHQEIKEQKRREALRQERLTQLQAYDGTEIAGLVDFTQEQFDSYLLGVKAQYEAKQKAEAERIEAERIENLHNERYSRLAKYADFIPGFEEIHFGVITDESYIQYGTEAKEKKEAHDAEQARIKAENDRLQKEKDEADKRMEARSNELKPYIVFIRDYNALIKSDEADYQKQFADIKKGAEDHWEYERQQQAKAIDEMEEREKASLRFLLDNGFEHRDGGVRYKSDTFNWFIGSNHYSTLSSDKEYEEFKKSVLNQIDLINLEAEKQKAIDEANRLKEAEQKRIQDEAKAEADRIAEQQRIANQGETERLIQWVESFELSEPVGNYSPEARGNIVAILSRFNGFKKWAKDTITNK
jgi:colicin import membrane protein